MKISSIAAWQIFDSRGIPTLEAEVLLENGILGRGAVPSGASTGQFEAVELRDGDPERFRGKSVFQAIAFIESEIATCLSGWNIFDQAGLDRRLIDLDGTSNKRRLGANTILAVSMAAARAAAAARNVSLYVSLSDSRGDLIPLPEIQIVGGGMHANRQLDIQDFLFIPHGARSYAKALEMAHNVYHSAGDLLRARGRYCGIADEGGYWPQFESNEAVLPFLVESIERAGYEPGRDGSIALDVAASNLYDGSGRYVFDLEGRELTREQFADLLAGWCSRYPIVSIEDPMADTDWEGWSIISRTLDNRLQIIADDLVTTNVVRMRQAIDQKTANAVLIKLNQIGTVTETLAAVKLAQEAGWTPVISARSGETEDTFIAHLAVATNAGQLKVGSFARSERMAKWNDLIRIERELGPRARYLVRAFPVT
ncbi:MAG TPA: phosphopyruvate hydratase [Bryobacteraceae bacterium]|nr:phosphopyruvate hydratase [Bryobacteraceae bacterium]